MRRTTKLLVKALPSSSYILFTKAETIRKNHYTLETKPFIKKCEDIGSLFLYYEHVFFRPDDKRFILLDDLTTGKVEALKQIYKVRAIIESSPSNFQVWLHLAIPEEDTQKIPEFIKHLAAFYGADIKATSTKQMGRMPYTRNCKPKYLSSDGKYPSAKFKYPKETTILPPITEPDQQLVREYNEFEPEIKTIATSPPIQLKPHNDRINQPMNMTLFSPGEFYLQAYQEMLNCLANAPKIDRSRLDYSIAKTMYQKYSYNIPQIAQALQAQSQKAKEIQDPAYIRNVIQRLEKDQDTVRLLDFNFIAK